MKPEYECVTIWDKEMVLLKLLFFIAFINVDLSNRSSLLWALAEAKCIAEFAILHFFSISKTNNGWTVINALEIIHWSIKN